MVDRLVYNTVLSQAFSPCGNFLAAANIYGDIAVYSLSNISAPSEESKTTNGVQHPLHHVIGLEDGHICSLVSTPDFLIAGGTGVIRGWAWKSVISAKNPQSQFDITLPAQRDALEKADVNSLIFNSSENHLYAGCGDNNIYVLNLENGKKVRTMEGHTGFIHSIHSSDNQIVSASEDGTVRLWEMRQSSATSIMKPYENDKVARPEIGKWVGAANINDDWMVCGGGPKLSLWHLRSMEVTTVFPITDLKGIHVAKFHEDRIFAGGAGRHFYQLSLDGRVHGQIPTSASTVYSAELRENPHKILAIAGSSMYIDICTNFNYLDQKLTFALK